MSRTEHSSHRDLNIFPVIHYVNMLLTCAEAGMANGVMLLLCGKYLVQRDVSLPTNNHFSGSVCGYSVYFTLFLSSSMFILNIKISI